jgi:hypothetical protein
VSREIPEEHEMSIRPRLGAGVPELTARMARASNPAGPRRCWVQGPASPACGTTRTSPAGIPGTGGKRPVGWRGRERAVLSRIVFSRVSATGGRPGGRAASALRTGGASRPGWRLSRRRSGLGQPAGIFLFPGWRFCQAWRNRRIA